MSELRTIIVIPARYASSRLPGKPLELIAGKMMIQRTWELAKAVSGVDEVYIATDDDRIKEAGEAFGAKVIMTSESCSNGTERVFEVATSLKTKPDIIINFQGDSPLTPPSVLTALVARMKEADKPKMVTPAVKISLDEASILSQEKAKGSSSGTLVTFNLKKEALYFSSAFIPFARKGLNNNTPVFRHIGIYAYDYDTLIEYQSLEPTPLEKIEQLEQLRALENGITINIVEVDLGNRSYCSVDAPEDVIKVEAIISKEGELVR